MKQTYVNYFIDWVIFLAMLVLFATGLVHWGWKRPAASPAARPDTVAQARPESKPTEKTEKAEKTEKTEKTDAKPVEKADAKPGDADSHAGKTAGPAAGQPQGLILWGLFRGNSFLGMTKNGGWKSIHCWVSMLVLLPFMLLHFFMHLKWVLVVTASFFKPRKADVVKE